MQDKKNGRNKDESNTEANDLPGLRLVPNPDETPKAPPPKKNSFVQFMTSYADAIDEEIKNILQL